MKTCRGCGATKPLTEFYRHPQMGDGHLNHCKECKKADTRAYNAANREARSAYNKARAQLPHRVEQRKAYRKTEQGKAARLRHLQKKRAAKDPGTVARDAVQLAILTGRLTKQPCLICGEKAEAHHPAYSMPLDVVWLCHQHHVQVHKEAAEA